MAARFGLALGLAACVSVPAQAQPLMPNPGLTSLLQPQRLDRARPLIPEDRAAGTRSGLRPPGSPGAAACDRRGAAAPGGFPPASARPSLYGSGSGPGDYGRYMPGSPPPADPAKKPADPASQPGTSRAATDGRPLYDGVSRPLWDTGERRAAATTKTASASETGKDPGPAARVQPNTLPAPAQDRPLWADGGRSGPPSPAAGPATETASGAAPGGIAASPCTASPASPLPR